MMPLDLLFKTTALAAIVVFCVFRVSEINWRLTHWADTAGWLCAGIGAFWKFVLNIYVLTDPAFVEPLDTFPALMLYMGFCLIMFSATCYRLRGRRRSDHEEHGYRHMRMNENQDRAT